LMPAHIRIPVYPSIPKSWVVRAIAAAPLLFEARV
jgi:hypothetical protein